ncbi:MAG: hypothetical protein ACTSUE_23760 [Promethearchaeota archaeon]
MMIHVECPTCRWWKEHAEQLVKIIKDKEKELADRDELIMALHLLADDLGDVIIEQDWLIGRKYIKD